MMKTRRLLLAGVFAAVTIAAPRAAIAQAESRAAMLYRESYALEAKRDYAGAMARVREVKGSGGNAYFATVRLAWLDYLAGDFGGSVTAYNEASAMEPNAVEPRLGATLPLLAARRWADLEKACRDVMTLDPHNSTALSRLATAQYWSGNFADATVTYRRLSADYPSDLDYKTGLGWSLLKSGKANDARQQFEAVLAVSPDNVLAKQGLAAR